MTDLQRTRPMIHRLGEYRISIQDVGFDFETTVTCNGKEIRPPTQHCTYLEAFYRGIEVIGAHILYHRDGAS